MARSWLSPPRLLVGAGTEEERHATWLELFFDLVYVVAIAELTHLLHGDLTALNFAQYAFLFLPVWWVWTWFAYYADQFETDDLAYRVATIAAMFGTIVLALSVHDAFHGGSVAFAVSYVMLRLLLIALYVRAWRHVPEARALTARFIAGFSIGALLWLLSIALPEPLRFWLWGLGLSIELVTPPLAYVTVQRVPAQISHMPERFGLFVLIVLGESLVAVASGVGDISWQLNGVLTAIAGFSIAVCFWCLFFEQIDASVITQSVRSDRRGLLVSHIYGYSHYLISAGIGATSAGILAAIEAAETSEFGWGAGLALCGGVALFLLGVVANHAASPQPPDRPILIARIVAAGFCMALLLSRQFTPLLLAASLAIALVGLVLFEAIAVRWRT